MQRKEETEHKLLTGRIQIASSNLLYEEMLTEQFTYELHHLLPSYIWIEKVLLLEYARMGLLTEDAQAEIGLLLAQISKGNLVADRQENMTDIAFAIEQYVLQRLTKPAPAWHVDRSRNDYQACAQLMFARTQLLKTADCLWAFANVLWQRAEHLTNLLMPGYTHYQAAQVISPGFYLSAMLDQVLATLQRLDATYSEINRCPLGAGAMAGQQLPWQRELMASLLGFQQPQRHALVAVASRLWVLQIASEFSLLATTMSRFLTDIIAWGSSAYKFIDLPDELCGISSAMPQKKNFPVLERLRGQTAHINAFFTDFVLGQRNTPFTNLVEVSKEAGRYLLPLFTTLQSLLALFTTVIEHVQFQTERMHDACEQESLGGFTLANQLTLEGEIPYRTAQVIAGHYISALLEQQCPPTLASADHLRSLCARYGYTIKMQDGDIHRIFNCTHNLWNKQSTGSTHPEAVQDLLAAQRADMDRLQAAWSVHRQRNSIAGQEVDILLASKRSSSI